MTKKVTIKISLGIQGPMLCKETAPSSWGIDATFDRDFNDKPYIDRSHIKGKLREALSEVGTETNVVNKWLGYKFVDRFPQSDSEPGNLLISDFYCTEAIAKDRYDNRLTRTRMDRDRGVVDETALLCMENAFPKRNSPYIWNGSIEFYSYNKDSDLIKDIFNDITAALKWITAFGAEKSVGFGKLNSVKTELCIEDIQIPVFTDSKGKDEWYTITIDAIDPILIGGVKRKAVYLESEPNITGSVIKGSLSATLNRICGVQNPYSTPITADNKQVSNKYPALSKYFSEIRFTHSFPTKSDTRPVVIPYSAVSTKGACHDVALCDKPQPIRGVAPIFQTDWKDKDYPDGFGWAFPRSISKTRTGIDENLRRAEDNMMFTYQYVCPVDRDGNKIIWRGLIRLPKEDRESLHAELLDVLPRITRMGKRGSKVEVSITLGKCSHAQSENDSITGNGDIIVSLQSDALMVNPDDMPKKQQTAEKLRDLYKQYWQGASGKSMEMVRFFAHQKLLGGYLVKRNGGKYYPFYLTGAGSVFVMYVSNREAAMKEIEKWKSQGLPLPDWVRNKYKKANNDLWQTCPFIPENGYGEVMVNLKWHFDKRIDRTEDAV